MARRLLAPGGTLLLPKGAEADSEFATLPALDRDAAERLASRTSPDATILRWSARDG
jgi:hypothetical protein